MTTGEPRLLRQILLRTADPEYTLAIAAAMETLSTHPYARALIGAVQSLGKSLPPLTDGRVEASAGIEATVGGRRYRLGKMEFALVDKQASQRADVAAIAAREGLHAATTIVLADAEGPVALFVFGERLRDDAASMIDTVVEHGVEPILISGDRRAPVHAVAASLGIERALAHQTPHSKCEWVVGQQRAGNKVAMLGDGINDAPALARADVSIALADGSATAQQRADLIVQSSRSGGYRVRVHGGAPGDAAGASESRPCPWLQREFHRARGTGHHVAGGCGGGHRRQCVAGARQRGATAAQRRRPSG